MVLVIVIGLLVVAFQRRHMGRRRRHGRRHPQLRPHRTRRGIHLQPLLRRVRLRWRRGASAISSMPITCATRTSAWADVSKCSSTPCGRRSGATARSAIASPPPSRTCAASATGIASSCSTAPIFFWIANTFTMFLFMFGALVVALPARHRAGGRATGVGPRADPRRHDGHGRTLSVPGHRHRRALSQACWPVWTAAPGNGWTSCTPTSTPCTASPPTASTLASRWASAPSACSPPGSSRPSR